MIAPFVQRALAEFRQGRTIRDIQHETALVWAGRAIAARAIGQNEDAVEYAHEAIEHAALSGVPGLIDDVRRALHSGHAI